MYVLTTYGSLFGNCFIHTADFLQSRHNLNKIFFIVSLSQCYDKYSLRHFSIFGEKNWHVFLKKTASVWVKTPTFWAKNLNIGPCSIEMMK
jgi:hypothetical protein